MEGNRIHTSIVIELGNQEDPEYQKAYQFEFGDMEIPRDYVIDQIFCGENMTIYAVFEITEEPRKPDKSLEEPNFDVHGDYRIYRETPSRKLLTSDNFCKFIPEVQSKEEDMALPSSETPGVIYQFPPEDNQEEERKEYDSTVVYVPEKISLGTNTSLAKFGPLFYDKKAIQDNVENKPIKMDREKESGQKSRPKEKNKNAILKEIKKLQKKINSLIKTIESSDFEFDAEDLEISGGDNCEEVPKKLEMGVVLKERNNNNKYDDLPILSPLTYKGSKRAIPKQKKTRAMNIQDRWEIPVRLKRSVSMLSVGSSATQIIKGCDKSEVALRKVSSECYINWNELENWRGAGHSKSEMISHVILPEPKYNIVKGAKKTLSLELRDDKFEVICCKKIKNFPFKIEGSLKAKGNMRIIPKLEPSFRDNLSLPNCEMGDDANKKTKTSKVDLLDLVEVCDKQNALSFEKINLTPNKNLNEEEGDAKLIYSKQTLTSSRFSRNNAELEVHFCNTTNPAPEGLLKNEKNFNTSKLKLNQKTENNIDQTLKVCSDLEKPTTPCRSLRKLGIYPEGKKETKIATKSYKKKPRDNSEKTEGKDVSSHEPIRPKSVTNNRKSFVKGCPETKTHSDRAVKSDLMTNQKISYLGKRLSEEKTGNKNDRLRKPISQKRETADPPNEGVECKEKESKPAKKNCATVNFSQKKSATGLTTEKPESVHSVENEPGKSSDKQKNQTSESPSSVVVELFSKKPQPEDMVVVKEKSFAEELNPDEEGNPEGTMEPVPGENNEKTKDEEDSDEIKKPIVKSLWALTKLILFEDGTQKLEILEASLNPPEWV